MKKIFTAIVLGLLSVTAIAEPCMDANVSALGYHDTTVSDEAYLDEHGC